MPAIKPTYPMSFQSMDRDTQEDPFTAVVCGDGRS